MRKYCSFSTYYHFHSYIGIFSCDNNCMLFWQIFTIPDVSRTPYLALVESYETDAGLSIAAIDRSDAPRYLKYWAKLYHECRSDLKSSYKIYMISEVTWFFVFGGRGVAHVTKYQPDPKSHCSRRGLNSYTMSLLPSIYWKHSQLEVMQQNVAMSFPTP